MRVFQYQRAFAALTSSVLLGAALAGCGGNATSSLPSAAGTQSGAQSVPAKVSAPVVNDSVARANGLNGTITVPNGPHNYTFSNVQTQAIHAHTPASGSVHSQSKVYPADLQYYGGPVMATANVYDIYLDSLPGDYNYPKNFLNNLFSSNMIHITDQYVGTHSNNRYHTAGEYLLSYQYFTTLGDNDLASILHTVGSYLAPGGSSKNVYNIFLAPGVDYCGTGTFQPAGYCNASPTSPNPYFCAFHGSVNFSDVGQVLYTLEPYNYTDYCGVNYFYPNAVMPNGVHADSTDSMLSHELFETFTDPIPGYGWYTFHVGVRGEIGDLCAYIASTTNLNAKKYFIQMEYSNHVHACTNTAGSSAI